MPCGDLTGLERLLLWIKTEHLLDTMRTRWKPYESIGSSSIDRRIEELSELSSALADALVLFERNDALILSFGFTTSQKVISWETDREFLEVLRVLEAIRAEEQAAHATAVFDRAMASVNSSTSRHPVVGLLAAAVQHRALEQYHEAFAALVKLDEDRAILALCDQFATSLKADAPLLFELLCSLASDPVWDERMAHFQQAWEHARASSWMRAFERPGRLAQLMKQLEAGHRNERSILQQLSAELAWLQLFKRMTRAQSENLRPGPGSSQNRQGDWQIRSDSPATRSPIYGKVSAGHSCLDHAHLSSH